MMKHDVPVQEKAEGTELAGERERILQFGLRVLNREAQAIRAAADRLGDAFVGAVQRIVRCRGRVAVTGMGKAGLIGNKIQATLASTATPSYRLHPVEALHGDLGMICPDDVVLALSRSGETDELIRLVPLLKGIGCDTILLTAAAESRLAALSDIVLDIGSVPEACPLGLAPSSSTAAMLAMGDALALAVMELKQVQPEQYARYHPAGALGRSLLKVHEVMRTGDDCPRVHADGTLADYHKAVRRAPHRAGAAAVVNDDGTLAGFFTHGDLFRLILSAEGGNRPADCRLAEVMTRSPKFARASDRVSDALATMQEFLIDELPVLDDQNRLVGLLDIQDLLARGFSVFDEP